MIQPHWRWEKNVNFGNVHRNSKSADEGVSQPRECQKVGPCTEVCGDPNESFRLAIKLERIAM